MALFKPSTANPLEVPVEQLKLDKIIVKIQKLLAKSADLSKGAGSEAEAAAFLDKAQSLMADYNLEMATIEASGRVADLGAGGKREKAKTQGRAMYSWQKDLMKYVAHANYCYHIITFEWYQVKIRHCSEAHYETLKNQSGWEWNGYYEEDPEKAWKKGGDWRHRPAHILVGRQANVVTAQHMFDYLCKTVERLVPIESNSQRLSRSAMSWKDGCSDRLCNRLWRRRDDIEVAQKAQAEEAHRKATAAGSTGTGMVLLGTYAKAEKEANYEHAHNLSPGTLQRWRDESDLAARERSAELALQRDADAAALAAMTPEKRAKFLAKKARDAAKEDERYRKAEARRERARQNDAHRKWEKRDHSAYNAGQSAGKTIGLDPQVSAGSTGSSKRIG